MEEYENMRKGECKKCGGCCRKFYLSFSPEELKKILITCQTPEEKKDIETTIDMLIFIEKKHETAYQYTCKYFIENPDGTGLCHIYENELKVTKPKRPYFCKDYPASQHQLPDDKTKCGYYFEYTQKSKETYEKKEIKQEVII